MTNESMLVSKTESNYSNRTYPIRSQHATNSIPTVRMSNTPQHTARNGVFLECRSNDLATADSHSDVHCSPRSTTYRPWLWEQSGPIPSKTSVAMTSMPEGGISESMETIKCKRMPDFDQAILVHLAYVRDEGVRACVRATS